MPATKTMLVLTLLAMLPAAVCVSSGCKQWSMRRAGQAHLEGRSRRSQRNPPWIGLPEGNFAYPLR